MKKYLKIIIYINFKGAVDSKGQKAVDAAANLTKAALDEGQFELSTDLWAYTENVIMREAHYIDFYNVLKKIKSRGLSGRNIQTPGGRKLSDDDDDDKLDKLMNGKVKQALNLNVTFGRQSGAVFSAQSGDFMKPVTHVGLYSVLRL